jgi:hypothetical protein
MTRRARLLLIVLVALLLASCSRGRGRIVGVDAQPGAVPDLAGDYVLNGVDPEGNEYGGVLTILPDAEAGRYDLQWVVTGSIQEGTGILDGNRLRLEWRSSRAKGAWHADSTRRTQGRGVYTVTTLKELYGTRSVDGAEGEAAEKAFPNLRR